MGELRSIQEASQAWAKIFGMSLGCRHAVFLFGPQGGLSILYALSLYKFTYGHPPTGAAECKPSSPTLLTKKQMSKEMERLTTQLPLMTSKRNELRDLLILISEGSLDIRYSLFQVGSRGLHLQGVPVPYLMSPNICWRRDRT